MPLFTSKVFYRVLGVLTMGNFFLPIVFENVFAPLSMVNFYLLAWASSLLVFHPKVYISKSFVYVYLFAAVYAFLIYEGFFDAEPDWIIHELRVLFFAILILQYHIISKDFKGLALLMWSSLFFITTTLLTTIIGLHLFPEAVRAYSQLHVEDQHELIAFYQSIGIAGYGFFYGLAFAIPVIVAFLKKRQLNKSRHLFLFLFLIIAIYGLINAQYATAFLFAIIGSVLAVWTKEKMKPTIVRLLFVLAIILLIPKSLVADAIYGFSQILQEGALQDRLIDLSITTRMGLGVADTHIDFRADRVPYLLDHFYASPIIGGGESLGHNYWLDRLSMFGLAGIIFWFLVIKSQIQANLKHLHQNNKVYYLIVMVLFIGMGFMKNLGQTEVQVFVFFVVPALLILKGKMSKQ